MATTEAKAFYFDKGRTDFLNGQFEQPFPFPTKLDLDDFETFCNEWYTKGYQEERLQFESFAL
ncbi:MAG TPA: hypothetical protein VG603_15985 [Chitinophagales bacterium]|nr:hypothetical protein [Chitinophagales bacterium]